MPSRTISTGLSPVAASFLRFDTCLIGGVSPVVVVSEGGVVFVGGDVLLGGRCSVVTVSGGVVAVVVTVGGGASVVTVSGVVCIGGGEV